MTNRICSIADCGRKVNARGLCGSHYHRLMRYGDPLTPLKYVRRPNGMPWIDYFWFRVAIGEPDTCWDWIAGRYALGYGTVFLEDGTVTTAHTVAYELTYGPIPDGLVVRHTCDRPPCVNPAHLLVGTQADNLNDMWVRGRANPGGRNSHGSTSTTEVSAHSS